MQWPEVVTSRWEDFDDLITKMIDQGSLLKERFFFRGQSKKDWALIPSFTRILNNTGGNGFLLAPFEGVVVNKFKAMARQHIPGSLIPDDEDLVGWWHLMQHYRAPTRLLDWSTSPYVAAYFAVTEKSDEDGAIWIVNYSSLEKAVDAELTKQRCPTTQTDTWYIKNSLLLASTAFIRAANTKHRNQRAVIQQGELMYAANVFSDHGYMIRNLLYDWTEYSEGKTGRKTVLTGFSSEIVHKGDPKPLVERKYFKIIIPKESKIDFLARLHLANISASSLFPGLDGVGSAIREEIEWQIYVAIKSQSNRESDVKPA